MKELNINTVILHFTVAMQNKINYYIIILYIYSVFNVKGGKYVYFSTWFDQTVLKFFFFYLMKPQ